MFCVLLYEQLLWTTRTGLTGLVAITLVPFIVLPMTVPYLKTRMPYELRKGLHYLSVVWGAGLMWHAPERIYFLIGISLFVYITDKVVDGPFQDAPGGVGTFPAPGRHQQPHLVRESAGFRQADRPMCT